jgi:hypothetical protein
MKHLTLRISDFELLCTIKSKLQNISTLSPDELLTLTRFLGQIPTPESELLKLIPYDNGIAVKLWDVTKMEKTLQKWQRLFSNIPGFDHSPSADIIDQNGDPRLFNRNVILNITFCPTLSHNEFDQKEPFEIHLKDDGTASFWFPTFEDAEQYPELFNFNGNWKDAYLLLIETMKKGWPMEEFPEELQQFLKK